jgi:VWFA-related protein
MATTRLLAALALVLSLAQVETARPTAAQRADTPPPAAAPQTDAAASQPQQADAAQQPTFRTGINFVRVDVIVTDRKQQPVMDLRQADFEVFEDGKPQTIEQFRLIRIDGNPAPGELPPREIRSLADQENEAARDDVRMFVFFLDDYHTRLGSALSVRDPLIRFIQTNLGPNDLVGIMYPLTPVADVSLTRNHASIISAIQRFEGRKFRYDPRNEFEERYAQYPTETVEQIRNQVVMGALRGLATRLGSLREGRKAIIYVSEGLTAFIPPEMNNPVSTLPTPMTRRGAGVLESSPRLETYQFFSQADLMSQLRDVFSVANRNNAAIYAVDPRGLAVNEFNIDEPVGPNQDRKALQATQDTLRSLAEETDGRAIVNRNDLQPGLAQIVRDSSVYYLIGYNSSQAPSDGKFHEIKVRVKRPGIDIRARRGYWAATAEDVVRASAPARPEAPRPVQQALASIASSVQAGKYVRTWLGVQRGENGKTRMMLVWEPLPTPPGVRRAQPGRVSLIAADAKGSLVFRGRTAEVDSAATASAPAPAVVVFDAPPGPMELRMSVEAAGGGGLLDSEIRTVTVPDLTSADGGLSTPRVYRARTARDFQSVAQNPQAVPMAGREFSRADRVLIRFDVYGAGAPTAALLNRNGQKMADIPVAAAVSGGTHQIDMGLGAVAPGEYLIEIALTDTPVEAKELVALRVVG